MTEDLQDASNFAGVRSDAYISGVVRLEDFIQHDFRAVVLVNLRFAVESFPQRILFSKASFDPVLGK